MQVAPMINDKSVSINDSGSFLSLSRLFSTNSEKELARKEDGEEPKAWWRCNFNGI